MAKNHSANSFNNKSDTKTIRFIAGAFIFVGSLMALVGVIWSVKTIGFVMHASKAQGVILEMERVATSNRGSTLHPIFSYPDASGVVHTQRVASGSSTYEFEPGQKVTVLYDTATPLDSKIDSFQTIWLGPLFFVGFGVLFGGFASVWLYLALRAMRSKPERFS